MQLQNLVDNHSLKSDRTGVIVSNNGFSNYSVKVIGSRLITKTNRASLPKIDPRSAPGYQGGHDSLLSVQEASELLGQLQRASRKARLGRSDGQLGIGRHRWWWS